MPQVYGICKILPDPQISEFYFDPRGYSMNGLAWNEHEKFSKRHKTS
ncbi:S-adenosylmethionine decarboxylase [Cynara cardunculus var. scolymus]|uniref:S-adenosylmethionine decarboxylase n=1 Tax=Cynara cardunculus var. scolymus TaxID=59895 RepID=A0A103XKR9_CYNCS|nr:S-adenosylmethionine decarboxylase [Cynara cardunculus var. scolymus]